MANDMKSGDAMVVTRRGKSTTATTQGPTHSESADSENDVIHVIRRAENKLKSPKSSDSRPEKLAHEPTRCDSVSDHGSSLPTPVTTESSLNEAVEEQEKIKDKTVRLNVTSSSSLSKPIPKIMEIEGGVRNPIVVTDSPPRPQPSRTSKQIYHLDPTPCIYQGEAIGSIYSKPLSRPPLAPKQINSTAITDHQSHNIYKMIKAKEMPPVRTNDNLIPGHNIQHMPFEVQYPLATRYLAQQYSMPNGLPPPQAQFYSFPPPRRPPPLITPSRNEDFLRKKAVQYLREHTCPSTHKRKLSEIDPDETSASESENTIIIPHTSPVKSRPPPLKIFTASSLFHVRPRKSAKIPVFTQEDPNLDINRLIEQNALVTSLLQMYPHSKDKKGLREDIAFLVSAQNQQMAAWMKKEVEAGWRGKKSNVGSSTTTSRKFPETQAAAAERDAQQNEKTKKKDDELRKFFSAGSTLWQDGSGQSVAEVYATPQSSSPRTANADTVLGSRNADTTPDMEIEGPKVEKGDVDK